MVEPSGRPKLVRRSSSAAAKDRLVQMLSFYPLPVQVQEEKAMAAVPQHAIEVHKLSQYFHERQRKKVLLKGEFLYVKRSMEEHSREFATRPEHMYKNAYPDVLPYDYNRVILTSTHYIPTSHYINASFIDSFYQPKAYIVTQACKDKPACEEFWRMVWEQNSGCIVMLTKVFDFMKVMCIQYFPVSRFTYGDIDVETVDMKVQCFYVIRTMKLRHHKTGEERVVHHCHYTEWGYNAYPYISALLDFRRKVRRLHEASSLKGPLVVHCSDGGGRSGVYLCIDANLELAQEESLVDVFGYCKTLLNSRPHTVHTFDDYVFMYQVLVEAVRIPIEPFSMYDLPSRVTKLMMAKDRNSMENEYLREYKLLDDLTPDLQIGDCAGGHRLENRGKNRDVMVVPPDHARPYLSTLHGESKDYTYINAVHTDGFNRRNEWIVTEWPKGHTLDSFWALIYDHNCHTVINLTTEDATLKMQAFPKIVHDKGRMSYGPFSVEVTQFMTYPYMTSHTIKVGKRTFMLSEIMMNNDWQVEQDVRVCQIFNLRVWPVDNQLPVSTSGLIDALKHARSWRERNPDRKENKPTVVLSHNGVSRCGVYIAANIVIDQMEMDEEVDIFHAVKLIRANRPQLVDTKEEYKYLYDLILHYFISTDEGKKSFQRKLPSVADGNAQHHLLNHWT